jgi:hypothetical protein
MLGSIVCANIVCVTSRPLMAGDQSWRHDALVRTWGSTTVARKGALIDASELPGLVGEVDGEWVGPRLVKLSIPMIGANGIPIRHELEFELLLDG